MGQQARKGPVRAKRARFPLVPPSGARFAAEKFKKPPNLKAVTMPVRLVRFVTASSEQRYPPKLDSFSNSTTFLNAAPSLCAVFQSLPE